MSFLIPPLMHTCTFNLSTDFLDGVIKIKHLEKSHCVSGTVLLVKHVYVTHKLFVFI